MTEHCSPAQLPQSQKMEAIGRLAGGLAHDINNHLVAILGYSDLLLDGLQPDDPLRTNAAMIKEVALRSSALIRQLLAFSRGQAPAPKVLDLNAAVMEMGKLLGPLTGEGIEMVTLLDPALGRLRADPAQMDQIILNLAVNARDAMPCGGRLTLQTSNVAPDGTGAGKRAEVNPGGYVRLAVIDNGMGMDQQTQQRMFEPFFTTKEPGKGTGLGLSTVREIVQECGGVIRTSSELGQGTTFEIDFPRVDEPVAAFPPRPGPRSVGKETVLVVEDDVFVRELACEFLSQNGYTVLTAGSGAEALHLSNRHPGSIHLLMTDVVIPGIGGGELAQHIRLQRPDTKVLFVSGDSDCSVHRKGILEPGIEFLQKPFTRDVFLHRVRALLDGAENQVSQDRDVLLTRGHRRGESR